MLLLIYLCLLKLIGEFNVVMVLVGIIAWIGHIIFGCVRSNTYDLQIKTLINSFARIEDEVVKIRDKK